MVRLFLTSAQTVVLSAVLFFASCSYAQPANLTGQNAVTFSPLSLMGIDYSFQAGFERRLSKKLAIVQEAGYIFGSNYIGAWRNNVRYVRGLLFRPSIKIILNERRSSYVQSQIFYKQVTHHMRDWLQFNVMNGVPAYEKLENFRYRRKVYGFNFITGRIVPLSVNSRLNLEAYVGIGIRVKREKVVDKRNVEYNRPGRFILSDRDGPIVLPQIPLCLRLFFYLN